jgi:hypothetical protein
MVKDWGWSVFQDLNATLQDSYCIYLIISALYHADHVKIAPCLERAGLHWRKVNIYGRWKICALEWQMCTIYFRFSCQELPKSLHKRVLTFYWTN